MPERISIAAVRIPVLGALVLAMPMTFFSCGRARESTADSESATAAASSIEAQIAEPSPGGTAREFETLDLCSLVPVADVSRFVGHEESAGSAKATMGRYATDCTYSFERGDGSSDYVMIWAYPPELWAPELKGGIEEVSGLGDAAFLTNLGSFAQMNVLLEADLYLDTRATAPEQARALAELAITRLTAM